MENSRKHQSVSVLQHHSSLYFDDGDIALAAELQAGTKQVFKVHRIFLCHFSEVFRSMFAVVSSDESRERYEGVPLVEMPSEDSADEISALLEVMYKAT